MDTRHETDRPKNSSSRRYYTMLFSHYLILRMGHSLEHAAIASQIVFVCLVDFLRKVNQYVAQ